jgi:hypothetical protein
MAVALLAFAEVHVHLLNPIRIDNFFQHRFGDDAIAQQHWLALREILQSPGGMEGLHLNRWLAATLYWNCLVWSGTSDRSTRADYRVALADRQQQIHIRRSVFRRVHAHHGDRRSRKGAAPPARALRLKLPIMPIQLCMSTNGLRSNGATV